MLKADKIININLLNVKSNHKDNLKPKADGDYCEKDYADMVKNLKIKKTSDYKFELPPMDQPNTSIQIKDHLHREYSLAILTTEMKLHKARQTRMDNDIQRYFNSTPLRNAFARWMTYGYLVNKPYNITTLCDEMYADRKTVSIMIKECEAEGWIQTIKSNGQLFCLASPSLVNATEDYIRWRRKLAKATIGKCFIALKNFDELMSIDTSNTQTFSTEL